MQVKTGQKAFSFKLKNQNGQMIKLSDFKGSWLLIYFYPKDDTPGCTKEACQMRDGMEDFNKIGLKVVGISINDEKSHLKFFTKYNLNFDLLVDDQQEVVQKYGVWGKKKFMGREYMGTFRESLLVDPKGTVKKIYEKIKPEQHAQQVLDDLKEMLKS